MRPVVQVVCRDYDPDRDPHTIVKIFNVIACPVFPASPGFDIVFGMQMEAEDIGRTVDFTLRMVQPDGIELEASTTRENLPSTGVGVPNIWWASFATSSLTFPTKGTYELYLMVDGEPEAMAVVELVALDDPRGAALG